MKTITRKLSWLLILTMLFSICAVGVYAEESKALTVEWKDAAPEGVTKVELDILSDGEKQNTDDKPLIIALNDEGEWTAQLEGVTLADTYTLAYTNETTETIGTALDEFEVKIVKGKDGGLVITFAKKTVDDNAPAGTDGDNQNDNSQNDSNSNTDNNQNAGDNQNDSNSNTNNNQNAGDNQNDSNSNTDNNQNAGDNQNNGTTGSTDEGGKGETGDGENGDGENGDGGTDNGENGESGTGESGTGESGTGESETGNGDTGESGTGEGENGDGETGKDNTTEPDDKKDDTTTDPDDKKDDTTTDPDDKKDDTPVETEKVDYTISVVWEDGNNLLKKRPVSIQVQLYQVIESNNSVNIGDPATITPDKNGNWSYVYKDLEKYYNGKTADYRFKLVSDLKDAGYTVKSRDFSTGVMKLQNNYKDYSTIDINVKATWVDNNNKYAKRPTSITVYLYQGDTQYKTVTITPDKNGYWGYTFEDLPGYKDGKAVTYTVKPATVTDYVTKTAVSTKDGVSTVTITNTYKDIPLTGDNTQMVLWSVLLLAAACGLGYTVVYKKQN